MKQVVIWAVCLVVVSVAALSILEQRGVPQQKTSSHASVSDIFA